MKSFLTFALITTALADEALFVPTNDIQVPDGLEVTLWAKSPLLRNPTNIDTDSEGRIWVAEGVNYRRAIHQEKGDRIIVLQDTNGDGSADSSHVFVQDPELISPLGISVFDNKIVVAQPPHILVYTDKNRNQKFDPGTDTREEFLSGFNARNHDHSLHTIVAGPDGRWYFSQGNCGARITDKDGRVFQSGSPYYLAGAGNPEWFNDPTQYAGQPSADGKVYTAGFAARIQPDGSGLEIIGHGFRNSYELCTNSLGDVFQNDNDDLLSCRNTWLMEGGWLGFASRDGSKPWQMDRRPGQIIPSAHWRQDDPGALPAGDIYGSGSPTGVAFYENGSLPKEYEGMFLSCEARARIVQRYHPKLSKSSSAIELGKRTNLIASKENLFFRPSDIMVGADGALYLSDWYDTKVGGHKAEDPTHSGAIYRIAPKGFKPRIPKLTGNTIDDAVTLLKSPAPSVRITGFQTLKNSGASAYPAVKKFLSNDSPWFRARAVWLLPYLGEEGIKTCQALLKHKDPSQRILAFRSLRAAEHDVLKLAKNLVTDSSPAVRREVAVSLRHLDPKAKLPLVNQLFSTLDVNDRHALEACGLAAEGIEEEVWTATKKRHGTWPSMIAWRLQPKAAVRHLTARANSKDLSFAERKFAMETLAFIGTQKAIDAIAALASEKGDLSKDATWWLISRGLNEWKKFGTRKLLKDRGLYDPETVVIEPVVIPDPPKTKLPTPKQLLNLTGDPVAGKAHLARCFACHQFDGVGIQFGPDLRNWVANQGKEAFFEALIHPSSGIAHGYQGKQVTLKNGDIVQGLLFGKGDPAVVVSTGGFEQYIPADRVKGIKTMWKKSLMLSADQLGFNAQQLADLAAYLETYNSPN